MNGGVKKGSSIMRCCYECAKKNKCIRGSKEANDCINHRYSKFVWRFAK